MMFCFFFAAPSRPSRTNSFALRFFALPRPATRSIVARKPERRLAMQLSQILTRDVETIRPDTSAREAAQRMRSMDVGALPVCDGRRLLGMVTDRDLTLRILAEG